MHNDDLLESVLRHFCVSLVFLKENFNFQLNFIKKLTALYRFWNISSKLLLVSVIFV